MERCLSLGDEEDACEYEESPCEGEQGDVLAFSSEENCEEHGYERFVEDE